jgi:hypothetical protein
VAYLNHQVRAAGLKSVLGSQNIRSLVAELEQKLRQTGEPFRMWATKLKLRAGGSKLSIWIGRRIDKVLATRPALTN